MAQTLDRTRRRGAATAASDPADTGKKGKKKANKAVRSRKIPSRGWPGTGGGAWPRIQAPPMWRGTSVQVCGLWPMAAGSGAPMIGAPIGPHLITGATVCCDPLSWFDRAKLISNPSMIVFAVPGVGKSTFIRHMLMGQIASGAVPMVLGDLKPDYVDLCRALNIPVLSLGRGRGYINPLDARSARAAAARLTGSLRSEIIVDAHARRLSMLAALVSVVRRRPPEDVEELVLDRALQILDDQWHPGDPEPLVGDLVDVITEGPEAIRSVTLDRGDNETYGRLTDNLVRSLMIVAGRGGLLGDVFAKHSSNEIDISRGVCYDLSSFGDDADEGLKAAALMACWSAGFAAVSVNQVLADAGLERRRHPQVVMDELWRTLSAGPGLVNRIDGLTRLNRTVGVGQVMISHTLADLESLPTEAERKKAFGFAERAGIKVFGALPSNEMPLIERLVATSAAERTMMEGWTMPPGYSEANEMHRAETGGEETPPPGRGKFMLKIGNGPGLPVSVQLTEAENLLSDTNKGWEGSSTTMRAHREASRDA